MTTLIKTIDELTQHLQPLRADNKIALVPTMGDLHIGHLSLVKQAQQHADIVVVSVFVNPTQFGAGEDFDSYPRTLDEDFQQLQAVKADVVFAPEILEMYPNYPQSTHTTIELGKLTTKLCGKSRPTHFNGMGLIVSKLFNIVQPHIAVFGKKDYQQLMLIRQLVADLNYPIEIIGGDIVRLENGLALSSRNQYLTVEEMLVAPKLHQNISELANKIADGKHLSEGLYSLLKITKQQLTEDGFTVDYLEVMTQDLTAPTLADKNLVILVAGWLGKARLLDNIEVEVKAWLDDDKIIKIN